MSLKRCSGEVSPQCQLSRCARVYSADVQKGLLTDRTGDKLYARLVELSRWRLSTLSAASDIVVIIVGLGFSLSCALRRCRCRPRPAPHGSAPASRALDVKGECLLLQPVQVQLHFQPLVRATSAQPATRCSVHCHAAWLLVREDPSFRAECYHGEQWSATRCS